MGRKFKILFLTIFFLAFLIGEPAFASFNDEENSADNIYSAGVLDMALRSGQGNFIPPAEDMKPGDSTARDIYVGKTILSLPLKHRVSFEFISGDVELCDQLDLKLWYDHYHGPVSGGYDNRDMRLAYNGKLSALDRYTNTDFIIPHIDDQFDTDPSDGTEQWFYYTISLPNNASDNLQDKTCHFKFVYEAWQGNVENYEDGGFTDTKEIESTLKSGYWTVKINKVQYDSPQQGIDKEYEWIELYNSDTSEITLENWTIVDNTETDTIPTLTIPPQEFAIVAATEDGFKTNFPDVGETIVYIPDGSIGDGLANDGDMLILKDSDERIVDQMCYENDRTFWNPAPPLDSSGTPYNLAEGHMLGRDPNGYDTNQASDWKDFGLPEITITRPYEGEIWYVGGTGSIKWTATNPNGDQNPLSLSIDIWYSNDDGTTWANIKMDTENDGEYYWTPIPLYINGYYVPSSDGRIKIVATGPENFMINSSEISARFCPPEEDGDGEDQKDSNNKNVVDSPEDEEKEEKKIKSKTENGDFDKKIQSEDSETKEEKKKDAFEPLKEEPKSDADEEKGKVEDEEGKGEDGDEDEKNDDDGSKDKDGNKNAKSVDGIQAPK